ncbi:MAG: nicotinate-nucleotide adenylyltransferase [Abditibacteriota bacterium]|nr:nicotinate-nucleotide adenylyltransferase [Abditibacteriota bacterium]
MQGIKRLGVMGGTFDPIHVAHLALAEAARERFRLDRILFVVSANPPHKPGSRLTPAEQRLEMVRLAIADNPAFEACDLELRRDKPSYTADTLLELKALYPGAEKYLIVGIDEAQILHRWHDYETVLRECTVAAAWRPGYPQEDPRLPAVLFHAPEMNISSSGIRTRLAEGGSVRYLVPGSVCEYIKDKGLYV